MEVTPPPPRCFAPRPDAGGCLPPARLPLPIVRAPPPFPPRESLVVAGAGVAATRSPPRMMLDSVAMTGPPSLPNSTTSAPSPSAPPGAAYGAADSLSM